MRPGTWMTSCPEAMGWGFWNLKKKQWVEIRCKRKEVHFPELTEVEPVVCGGVPHVVGSDGKVSILRNCASLSSSRKTLNSKKVNKSFVPGPKKRVVSVSCFSDSYVYEHLWMFSVSVWICLVHVFVSWSYIFGPIYYRHGIRTEQTPSDKVW